MTIRLDRWLEQATRHLSSDSAAKVRAEIREHHESECESAVSRGANPDQADCLALAALGDPKLANREYRKVLLTSGEARLLRDGDWEARAVCSSTWLKWTLFATPIVALLAAVACAIAGATALARGLLLASFALTLFFVVPFLPVYTPVRGRIYRIAKWSVLLATLAVFFGPDALKYSWLLASSLWIILWIEWKRIAIRRKLPVSAWPKQLYL